ncbi:alpha/beta fold hydrolase [Saccharomonospora saliphila]|uniref:alpha/beta fold hydrolase n=1 Tax=Saccharomonospora saliphila TaxID=369829 RepID=UPI0003A12578|nr:alpha/beta hydrolase [Saccharomonospora saliphila]
MDDWTLSERFDSPDGAVRWGRQGSGPPVVLLHGTPFSSVVWRDIAAALSARHEVYVWDMLGYGQSAMHEGHDVSLGAQQRIFSALLEHWGLDSPAVVAHDFGGTVALRTALLSGNRYARLALFDAVALGDWGTGFFRLARDNRRVFTSVPEHLHEAMVRGYIATASHHGLPGTLADELVRPWLGSEGQAAFYRQIAQNDERFTREIESRYAELDMPVLIGWGAQDTWLPPEFGARLAERIPNAEFRLFGSAGHLVQLDAPAQVTAALGTFL